MNIRDTHPMDWLIALAFALAFVALWWVAS